jgi:excisionase family DNA binding protein
MNMSNDTNPPLQTGLHVEPTHPRLAYSVKEAAQILGVSEKTIRRLVARGLLRSSKALRHLLIPKKEIERFLETTTA